MCLSPYASIDTLAYAPKVARWVSGAKRVGIQKDKAGGQKKRPSIAGRPFILILMRTKNIGNLCWGPSGRTPLRALNVHFSEEKLSTNCNYVQLFYLFCKCIMKLIA